MRACRRVRAQRRGSRRLRFEPVELCPARVAGEVDGGDVEAGRAAEPAVGCVPARGVVPPQLGRLDGASVPRVPQRQPLGAVKDAEEVVLACPSLLGS